MDILVVDDDEQVRWAVRDILSLDGHAVTTVEDAAAALEYLETHHVHLLITDLGLPGLSGLQLSERVSQTGSASRIVLVTGLRPNLTEEMLREHGICELFPKPFQISELRALVKRLA